MAISRLTAKGTQKTQITLYSAAMATCLFAAAPTYAQTVIIGGGNDRPVIVNYPPAYPQAGTPYTSGMTAPTQNGVDYSKGARIDAGDEVIVLTPPSEQKKKPARVVHPPKKKPVEVETAEQTNDSAPDQITKTEPVKKVTPKEVVVAKETPAQPTAEPVEKQAASQPVVKAETVPEPKAEIADKTETPDVTSSKDEIVASEPEKPSVAKVENAAPVVTATEKVEETVEEKAEEKSADAMADATAKPSGPKQIAPVKAAEPAEEKEEQVAALTPQNEVSAKPDKIPEITPEVDPRTQTLMFEKEETSLPNTAASVLEKISTQVSKNQDRVQIVAYADASSNGRARRISLGRALSIRTKLMELGVPNNRIEVRALGLPTDNAPADRVELKIITR